MSVPMPNRTNEFREESGRSRHLPAGGDRACSWLHTAVVLADLKISDKRLRAGAWPDRGAALHDCCGYRQQRRGARLRSRHGGARAPIPDIDRMFRLFARDEPGRARSGVYDGYELLQNSSAPSRASARRVSAEPGADSRALAGRVDRDDYAGACRALQIPADEGVVTATGCGKASLPPRQAFAANRCRLTASILTSPTSRQRGSTVSTSGVPSTSGCRRARPLPKRFDRSSRTFWAIGRSGPECINRSGAAVVNSTRSLVALTPLPCCL